MRSIEFVDDIKDLIVEILDEKHGPRPGLIVETGPYFGQGSMRMLAEAQISSTHYPETITHYALEAVWEFVLEARARASAFRWIRVYHALPTSLEDARKFVAEDKWRDEHPEIPHDYPDARKGYEWEISDEHLGIHYHIPEQAWFSKHLPRFKEKCPLFFLDSGGGTGWLEWKTMAALMADAQYYVIIDDCNHVKHWRSYEYIRKHKDWYQIISQDSAAPPRWTIAFHEGF